MKYLYWIVVGVITCLLQINLFSETSSYYNRLNSSSNQCPKENAKYFEGFDITAGLGFGGITLMTTHRRGNQSQGSTDYGADGVAVQLKIGGNYAFYKMGLIGLEVYGQYNSAETEHKLTEAATSTTSAERIERMFSLKWNLGFDVKIGLAPLPSSLIFIYGGPDWGYYDFQYIASGVNNTHTSFKLGGVLGAGLEQLFADHWILKATFDYRWYSSSSFSFSNGDREDIKARLATALFMVGYRF